MADCPKCGRQLTVAGSCIKCGTATDRSKWYAIAEDAEKQDAPKRASSGGGQAPRRPASAARGDWYKAAGMEAPAEELSTDLRASAGAQGEVPLSDDHQDWAEVSKGRRDPPFALMGIGAVVLLCLGAMFWYASRGTEESEPEPQVQLPPKSLVWDHSYGFKIDPPEGFKRVPGSGALHMDLPEFAQGVHGEVTTVVNFRDAPDGIEASYIAEVRTDTNFDAYVQRTTSDLGKLTPLNAVPDGMKAYPTKGFLLDMGPRKALVYVTFAKPDRYLSVWVVAPSSNFAKVQPKVEAAARAFEVVEPNGPRPGTSFAAHDEEE